MNRKQLREAIRKEIQNILLEGKYQNCIDVQYLKRVGISPQDIKWIENTYEKIARKTGDQGTCVLGNGIVINGKIAIRSYAQGSIGLERIKGEIIPFLKKKYPKLKVSYEWGNMDEGKLNEEKDSYVTLAKKASGRNEPFFILKRLMQMAIPGTDIQKLSSDKHLNSLSKEFLSRIERIL